MILLPLVCLASLVFPLQTDASSPAVEQPTRATSQQPTSQQQIPRQESLDQAVEVEGLLRLDVVVTDKTGNPVNGLGRSDFSVLDNGQPRAIIAFRTSSAAAARQYDPDSLILLIDTLDMQPLLADFERQQAEIFLRQNAGHLARPISIYSLDNTGFYRTAPPSMDGKLLADRVASGTHSEPQFLVTPPHPPSQVPIVDSSYVRSPLLMGLLALGVISNMQERLPGRKQLLWIGPDGLGTGAYPGIHDSPYKSSYHSTLQKLNSGESSESLFGKVFWFSTLLRQARLSIDVLSTFDDAGNVEYGMGGAEAWREFLRDNPTMQQANAMDLFKKVLAVQSGGRVLPRSQDLVQQMNTYTRDAGSYYTLTFDPAPAAHVNEYHSLQVQLHRPELIARTSTGYFDQSFFNDQPNPAKRKVTVAELAQIVQSIHSDNDGMHQLAGVTLTERLSDAKLKSLSAELHGKKTPSELEMIADESATLGPPPSEILADPPPDAATQQRILTAATKYLDHVIPTLPDFFATRTAVHYSEIAGYHELDTTIQPQPLQEGGRLDSTVLYRNGREVVENAHTPHATLATQHLETQGIFGPILATMRVAVNTPGVVTWSRWEQGATGRHAVFRCTYLGKPTVELIGCCSPEGNGDTKISSGFHGELVIDPESGAILRFQMLTNLEGFVPTERSDMTVTYGPVDIAGKTYILPVRSVNIWRARTVPDLKLWNLAVRTWGPYETQMNVFTYNSYHAFRGSSQVLPGFTQQSEQK